MLGYMVDRCTEYACAQHLPKLLDRTQRIPVMETEKHNTDNTMMSDIRALNK
ncbi:hypothetical protein SARC_13616, partial [Sphaeroforma arctica JP610]